MFKVSINITHIKTPREKINTNEPAIRQGKTGFHKTLFTTYNLGDAIQLAWRAYHQHKDDTPPKYDPPANNRFDQLRKDSLPKEIPFKD